MPLDGWDARVVPASSNPLGGAGVFADSLLGFAEGLPVWRVDVVPLPDEPGPWRLQLEFASNSLWRYRGWFVADLEVMSSASGNSAFPVSWHADTGLEWNWPHAEPAADAFRFQVRSETGAAWNDVLSEQTGTSLPAAEVLAALGGGRQTRHQVRVLALTGLGAVASRPVTVYPDGGFREGVVLGLPRPNPARDRIQMQLAIPAGPAAKLRIYDLRGRLVLDRSFPAGNHLYAWDGHDLRGSRAAAGTYIIRLEGSGPLQTRKVVLLH